MVKKMVKDAKYNPRTKLFEIAQTSLGRKEFHDIELEGQFYGYTKSMIGELIVELSEEGLQLPAKTEHKRNLDPVMLRIEQHLKVYYEDGGLLNCDEYLKVGKADFLLIDHDRGALKPGTILKTVSSPWQLNNKIKFEFFDIDSTIKYYETGKVTKLELIAVPPVFDILQSKEDAYRKIVYAAYPENGNGFKGSDFSLEPHEGLYYSIIQNSGTADFSFISANIYDMQAVIKDFDKIVLPACEFETKPSAGSKRVNTLEKGLLYHDEGYWKIRSKAKIAFE